MNIKNNTLNTTISNSGTMLIENSNNIRDAAFNSLTVMSNSGTMNMKNSKVVVSNVNNTGTMYGINITGSGQFTCDTCEFDITNKGTTYGVRTADANSKSYLNSIVINIVGNNTGTGYGLYSNNGSTVMLDGTVDVSGEKNAYGTYINTGSVTLGVAVDPSDANYGTANADVDVTNPKVQSVGTTTGIGVKNVNGEFNFYDGNVIGSTSSIPDTITHTEHFYDIPLRIYGTEEINGDGYCTSYLIYRPTS